jgi:hypothetical protein
MDGLLVLLSLGLRLREQLQAGGRRQEHLEMAPTMPPADVRVVFQLVVDVDGVAAGLDDQLEGVVLRDRPINDWHPVVDDHYVEGEDRDVRLAPDRDLEEDEVLLLDGVVPVVTEGGCDDARWGRS